MTGVRAAVAAGGTPTHAGTTDPQATERRPAAGVALAAIVLVAGPVALAFSSGAYFDAPRLAALLGVAAVLALVAVAAPGPFLPARSGGAVALAGVWLLAGWVLLSRDRSPLPDVAGDDAERVLLYAGFLAAGTVTWRSRTAARLAEPAVAAGILVVLGYALAGRWLPGLVHLNATVSAGGRLEQPLTYWNATGMLAALGAVLCVRMAGDRTRGTGLQLVAAAATVPLSCAVYLSFSRGAVAALLAGLLVLGLCVPGVRQLRAIAITLLTGAVGVAAAALLPGVRALEGTMAARERDGLVALVVTLAAMAAAAALTARAGRAEARGAGRAGALRAPRGTRWVAVVAIVLAIVGPVLASRDERGAGTRPEARFGASAQRFTSVSTNRYDYWRVALRTFGDHPLAGVGSGGWGVAWLQERPFPEAARDAHSLELETLAELGLVGAMLLALAIGGVARCAVLVQRRDPQLAAGACAGLTVWLAHAALDWDWEMPAVTLPALTLAAVLIARADAPGEKAPEQGGSGRDATTPGGDRGRRLAAGVPGRLLLVALAALCAATGAVALRNNHRCAATVDRARLLLPPGADGPLLAREALARCPAAPQAIVVLSYVGIKGHPAEATAAARTLARREPDDYRIWATLGRLERDPARALAARGRAHALNPRGVPRDGVRTR